MKIKKLIAVAMSVALICTVPAFSDNSPKKGTIMTAAAADTSSVTYTVSNGKATVSKCSKSASGEVHIAETYNGVPVTEIGADAFNGCSAVTNVNIPSSITLIGMYAFNGTGISDVSIPAKCSVIGRGAFANCKNLASVKIYNSSCTFYDDQITFCNSYSYNAFSGTVTSSTLNATIYGYSGSTAQSYAQKYNRNFAVLTDAPPTVTTTQPTTIKTTTTTTTKTTTSTTKITTTTTTTTVTTTTSSTSVLTTTTAREDNYTILDYDDSPLYVGQKRAIYVYNSDTFECSGVYVTDTSDNLSYKFNESRGIVYITALAEGTAYLTIREKDCIIGEKVKISFVAVPETTTEPPKTVTPVSTTTTLAPEKSVRIKIASYPTKTVYELNEKLDLAELAVRTWVVDGNGDERADN